MVLLTAFLFNTQKQQTQNVLFKIFIHHPPSPPSHNDYYFFPFPFPFPFPADCFIFFGCSSSSDVTTMTSSISTLESSVGVGGLAGVGCCSK